MAFPRPGTNAERILTFIASNPGATRNSIIKGLGLNPSPARTYLKSLVQHGLVKHDVDEQGFHHYTAKSTL